MLAEEEAQWQDYGYSQQWESHMGDSFYQNNTDHQRQLLVSIITVKKTNIRTPKKFAVITFKNLNKVALP